MSAFALESLRLEPIAHRYLDAKQEVVKAGYAREIDWQAEQRPAAVTEGLLLAEAAWVILNSGMRETVVRRLFPAVTDAFLGFGSAAQITAHVEQCRLDSLNVFHHPGKIDAILEFAGYVAGAGPRQVVTRLETDGPDFLCAMPYFGPATSRHLAKNLGLDIAKPDRHLRRLATAWGFRDPGHLCTVLSRITGDRVGVVDVVLWRYLTLRFEPQGVVATSARRL